MSQKISLISSSLAKTTKLLIALFLLIYGSFPAWSQTSFANEFSDPSLPNSWSFQHNGVNKGEFSLTTNPGYLRYELQSSTHPRGELESLWLYRNFNGDHWTLEFKAHYHLISGLGRDIYTWIIFDGLGARNMSVYFSRNRDDGYDSDTYRTGFRDAEETFEGERHNRNADDIYFVRITRTGQLVEVTVSEDGTNFTPLQSRTFTTALGSTQTIVINSQTFADQYGSYADFDYFRLRPQEKEVEIDIQPFNWPNRVSPKSKGKISVAVLTRSQYDNAAPFNATTVDPRSVLFGRTGIEASPYHSSINDVNNDGYPDMVLDFHTSDTGIVCGQESATLKGKTVDGTKITGTDFIVTIGCK